MQSSKWKPDEMRSRRKCGLIRSIEVRGTLLIF